MDMTINMKQILYALASLIFIACMFNNATALEKDHYDYKAISNIIKTVKTGNKNKIATLFRYPLKRRYPVPAIKDEQEMVKRFNEIFDAYMLNAIKKSDIKDDWSQVGWRGIMLNGGDLWFNGKKIYVVNYRTALENQIDQKIIQNQKLTLHASIKDFIRPVLEWDTKKFHLRVDKMAPTSFRYAVWKKGVSTSKKPDLILLNGIVDYEGTGGNHYYTFQNGGYSYKVDVIRMGSADSPPGRLQVYKGENRILSEDVVRIYE